MARDLSGTYPNPTDTGDELSALAKFFAASVRSGTAGYLGARQNARDAGLMAGDLSLEPPMFTDLGKRVIERARRVAGTGA